MSALSSSVLFDVGEIVVSVRILAYQNSRQGVESTADRPTKKSPESEKEDDSAFKPRSSRRSDPTLVE